MSGLHRTRIGRFGWILTTTLLGAAVLVAAARHAPPFREVSDGAILEIYTLQALHGRLLVGPYSRFGWHHPGPLYFFLQAPWYWISGLQTAGMQAGAIAINLAALGVVAWVLSTTASAAVAAAVSFALAAYVMRVGDLVASPWNPHIVVLPLVAYITAAAAFAATGRRSLLLWLVVIGSFLTQTHLAMAPVAAVLAAMAVASRLRATSDTMHSRRTRTSLTAAAIAALLWLPPIAEQLTHRPGNLAQIARFFVAGTHETVEAPTAAAAWASALTAALRSDFTIASGAPFRAVDSMLPASAAILELAGLVLAIWWWRRRREPFGVWLAAAALAASIVGLLSITRIVDGIVDHEIFWLSALGMLNAAVVAAAAVDAMIAGRRRSMSRSRGVRKRVWSRAATALPAGALVAAGIAMSALAMRGVLHRPRTLDDHAVDVVAAEWVQRTSDAGVVRPLVRIDQSIWPIAAGALLEVAKAGRPFAVDAQWITMYGEAFAATGREDGIVAIEGSTAAPRVAVRPVRPRP